jgi:hypothetical protein
MIRELKISVISILIHIVFGLVFSIAYAASIPSSELDAYSQFGAIVLGFWVSVILGFFFAMYYLKESATSTFKTILMKYLIFLGIVFTVIVLIMGSIEGRQKAEQEEADKALQDKKDRLDAIVEEGNLLGCKRLSDDISYGSDDCYLAYARKYLNASHCMHIAQEHQKGMCLGIVLSQVFFNESTIMVEFEPSYCDQIDRKGVCTFLREEHNLFRKIILNGSIERCRNFNLKHSSEFPEGVWDNNIQDYCDTMFVKYRKEKWRCYELGDAARESYMTDYIEPEYEKTPHNLLNSSMELYAQTYRSSVGKMNEVRLSCLRNLEPEDLTKEDCEGLVYINAELGIVRSLAVACEGVRLQDPVICERYYVINPESEDMEQRINLEKCLRALS